MSFTRVTDILRYSTYRKGFTKQLYEEELNYDQPSSLFQLPIGMLRQEQSMHAQTAIEIDYRKGGFCWSWWISMIGCLFVLFVWLVFLL